MMDQEVTGPDVAAIVGNGRQTGGGKQVAPRAFLDDGLLDLLVVREIPANKLLNAVRELRALSSEGQYISYWQVPWANFDAVRPVPVNLDGEPAEFTQVCYEATPGAVRLIAGLSNDPLQVLTLALKRCCLSRRTPKVQTYDSFGTTETRRVTVIELKPEDRPQCKAWPSGTASDC